MEQRKSGYQVSNGVITMFTPEGDVIVNLDFIMAEMRRATKSSKRESFYVKKIREYRKELELNGLQAVESVQAKLKSFWGASESGVRDCSRRWVELLQMIKNFSPKQTAEAPNTDEGPTTEQDITEEGAINAGNQ